jgi:radical SAM protein with 4Fe4S-binding SPASM domain
LKNKIEIQNLIFEISEVCNYNCKFCYNHFKTKEFYHSPRLSYYQQIIKTLATINRQAKVGHISISGGEPLLVDRLMEVILFLKLKRISVSLLSNGYLLRKEHIKTIIDLKVSSIQIPILSHLEKTHDYLAGFEGAWKKSIESIKSILELNNEAATAVVVVTRVNLAEIYETLELITSLGCKRILINRFNIGGSGIANNQELALNKIDLQFLFKRLDEFSKKNEVVISSGVCTPVCIINPVDYPNVRFSFCNTNFLKRPITINFMGEVRFCNHSPFILGNIHKNNLSDILENKEIVNSYNIMPEFCKGCDHFLLCNGGCRAASEQTGRTFANADPILNLLADN